MAPSRTVFEARALTRADRFVTIHRMVRIQIGRRPKGQLFLVGALSSHGYEGAWASSILASGVFGAFWNP